MGHEFMENTPQCPDIGGLSVRQGGDDFGGHVVGCSDVGLCECDFMGGECSGEAEITQFDDIVFIEED